MCLTQIDQESVLDVVLLLHDIVTPLTLGNGLILNGLGGASADAGHTVCAVSLPYRPSLRHADVI